MKKSIIEVKSGINKEIIILFIILIILIILLLLSKYIMSIKAIDTYTPFIIIYVILSIIDCVVCRYRIFKIEKNLLLTDELNNIILNVTGKQLLTKNYIVPYFGNNIIMYEDIVLIYYNEEHETHGHYKMINIVLKSGQIKSFKISTTAISIGYNTEPQDFTNILLEKNQNILIGLSEENKKIVYNKYNIKLK